MSVFCRSFPTTPGIRDYHKIPDDPLLIDWYVCCGGQHLLLVRELPQGDGVTEEEPQVLQSPSRHQTLVRVGGKAHMSVKNTNSYN